MLFDRIESLYCGVRTHTDHRVSPPAGLTNTSSSSNLVFPGGLPSRYWPAQPRLASVGNRSWAAGRYGFCMADIAYLLLFRKNGWFIHFLMLYFVIMTLFYYYCLYYFCHTNALLIYKHTDISQKITKHCSIFCPDFWLKLKTAVIIHTPKTPLVFGNLDFLLQFSGALFRVYWESVRRHFVSL